MPTGIQRRVLQHWLFVAALFLLCALLGVLQYRWIGEVSIAARERLQGSLQASLGRLSDEFNSVITADVRALLPSGPVSDAASAEAEIAARYLQWKTADQDLVFARIALAIPREESIELRDLDLVSGRFSRAEWPAAWASTHERLRRRLLAQDRRRIPAGPPPFGDGLVFEVPVPGAPPGGGPASRIPAPPGPPFGPRAWMVVELNTAWLRDGLLPHLVQRHLGPDYEVQVRARGNPPAIIYSSGSDAAKPVFHRADAQAGLLELRMDQLLPPQGMLPRRGPWGPPTEWARPPRGDGPGGPPPGMPNANDAEPDRRPPPMRERRARSGGPESGRWQIFVRHRSGSLEAAVDRARWRNLAVTGGVLLLIMASTGAILRFTRRAQRLAQLQIDFVAGVSHELRTPLTVIRTAAWNLRGAVTHNPAQVERYGAVIEQESARLTGLVEQVLRFAGAQAGRLIQESRPVCVETVIDEAIQASESYTGEAAQVVEKHVALGLPPVLGDPAALQHAIQNLLLNAAKHGGAGNWIGVTATPAVEQGRAFVEIRVADHGAGIPEEERDLIFEPFYRGRRAVQDQVRGTGLGLALVKQVVQAHGGTVGVRSEPAGGTEFVVRLPAASNGAKS